MNYSLSNDPSLERHSPIEHALRYLLLPFLNYIIPEKRLRKTISNLSDAGEQAVSRAGSSHAMESFYVKGDVNKSFSERAREYIAHNVLKATKSTRNRLKVVESILIKELSGREDLGLETSVVAFGGGTAKSFIDVVDYFVGGSRRPKLHILNIDLDASAHDRGRASAKDKGHAEHFRWVTGNALEALTFAEKHTVNIVEAIGLIEYLSDSDSIKVLKSAYELLHEDGLLIVGNVRPNGESRFYKRIGWPQMHYRTVEQFRNLIVSAGFNADKIEVIVEPLKMHNIAVVRK